MAESLQEIYDKRDVYLFKEWENEGKEAYKNYIDATIKNDWTNELIEKFLAKTTSGIASIKLPTGFKKETLLHIQQNWNNIQVHLKKILDFAPNNEILDSNSLLHIINEYKAIVDLIELYCNEYKNINEQEVQWAIANRMIIPFLYKSLTTICNNDDLIKIANKIENDYEENLKLKKDKKNWLENNYNLYKYLALVDFENYYDANNFAYYFFDKFCKTKKTSNNKEGDEMAEQDDNKPEQEIKELLLNTHNVILNGAPRTGKTYLAKDIAAKIVTGKDELTYNNIFGNDEKYKEYKKYQQNIAFVQFHPSYDYTDFVEGLRPTDAEDSDTNQIGFERVDGIFKSFCTKALKFTQSYVKTDNFDESLEKMLISGSIQDSNTGTDYFKIPYLSSKDKNNYKNFKIILNSKENGFERIRDNGEGTRHYFNFEQLRNVYKGLPGTLKGGHDNYRKAIVNYMKENFDLKEYKQITNINKSEKNKKQSFVFIIDEINRGEISKVLGELFYSIDPGYRGAKGAVLTQYANMQKDQNEFDEYLNIRQPPFGHFFVPENVYIIATMNDIDRSVETWDFATKGRFTWYEIKASDTADKIIDSMSLDKDSNKDKSIKIIAKAKLKRINELISADERLGDEYCIGASYFLKLETYNGDFEKLWNYHIEPLLKEYFRGYSKSQIKKKIDDYRKKYDES